MPQTRKSTEAGILLKQMEVALHAQGGLFPPSAAYFALFSASQLGPIDFVNIASSYYARRSSSIIFPLRSSDPLMTAP